MERNENRPSRPQFIQPGSFGSQYNRPDDRDEPKAQLTRGVCYETHRTRTPPKEVSYVGIGPGRLQGKGVRAQRSSKSALADLSTKAGSRIPADIDSDEEERQRDAASHDLLWPPRQGRQSVVDQMLSSFDRLDNTFTSSTSVGGVTFYPGPDLHLAESRSSSRHTRPRGHTYSSSTSSGPTAYTITESPRSQTRHNKNKSSGSNFQTTLDRIDSVRVTDQVKRPSLDFSRTIQQPRIRAAGRARKASKSSGSSSVDLGYTATASHQQRALNRRSVSLDHIYNRSFTAVGKDLVQETRDLERQHMMDYEDLEAAPTPSVPSGARGRRQHSVSSVHSQSLRANSGHTGLRRQGVSPQRPSDGPEPAMYNSDTARNGSIVLGDHDAQLQAPAVSTVRHRPTQSHYKATAFSPNATVSREKGGFFRRVFGGGSRTPSSTSHDITNEHPAPHTTTQSAQSGPAVRNGSMFNNFQSNDRQRDTSSRKPASSEQHQAISQPKSEPKDPPTLNKKSSFFRRRKKSIAVPAPAVPTLPAASQWQTPSRDHSPASSLRQVMNPYLASRPQTRAVGLTSRTQAGSVTETSDEVQLFPTQDAGTAYASLGNVHGHPDPGFQMHQQQPRQSAYHAELEKKAARDSIAQAGKDRASNGKHFGNSAVTTTTTTTTRAKIPQRSSSKIWLDRPDAASRPDGQSRTLGSSERDLSLGPARSEAGGSEISDNDFKSARSVVTSPVDEFAREEPRPLMPDAVLPSVASKTTSYMPNTAADETTSRPSTTATTKTTIVSKQFTTLDPLKTPTYLPPEEEVLIIPHDDDEVHPDNDDYAIAEQLFRFDPEEPLDDPALPSAEDEICPWLGEAVPERARVRKAYLEMFDWQNTSILTALHKFCEHIQLKGETQQVDRVLQGIARRWAECNPLHGFKAVDVVHAICYSLLLLNTDLHMANIESKMTRNQYINNTMQQIMGLVEVAAPDAFTPSTNKRVSAMPPPSPRPVPPDSTNQNGFPPGQRQGPQSPSSPREFGTVKLTIRRNPNEFQRGKFRLSARPSDNTVIEHLLGVNQRPEGHEPHTLANEDCGPLVKQPFLGGKQAWGVQVETVLKNFYNAIQKQRLPLQGSGASTSRDYSRAPSSLAGQFPSSGGLRRTPSMISKQSDGRGRVLQSRGTTSGGGGSRWTSRPRIRPRMYPASNMSMDDDMSMSGVSPAASSMWSKHSFGRTQTSMSVSSFHSQQPGQEAYQQSIGFANALSQAIIREEGTADGTGGDDKDSETLKAAPLLEDESLELHGAPWAKEGLVSHKHHLESVDKKAKERAWVECFAVIEKGWLSLFRFKLPKTATLRARTLRTAVGGVGGSGTNAKGVPGGDGKIVVGGGNWMDNAIPLERYLLRQTIASALPPPGYSKSRPHVWALSLPNGAVHLFQAGTPDIVREYVACANYWSARLSKEPLVGGVSNIEYGWSDDLLGNALAITQQGNIGEAPAQSGATDMISRTRSTSISSNITPIPSNPRNNTSRGFSIHSRPPSAMHSARPSLQNSIRSSFDTGPSSSTPRPRLPGDHAKIANWAPPPQSMVASALMEVDQLRVLSDYVANIKRELEKHNELRPAIQVAYSQRHPNYARTMANFEKKSSYLLREIVKFSTYVETLQAASVRKAEVEKERNDRMRELEEGRVKDAQDKVVEAEKLRQELSRSDLRIAAKAAAEENRDDVVPDVPALPAT